MSYRRKIHKFFNVSRASRWHRLKWWVYVNLLDHGIFRHFFQNLHSVAPEVFRSSQPTTKTLERFARNGGKVVLSLRGSIEAPYWYQEQETCSRLGLNLFNIPLSATTPPDVDQLKQLIDFLGSCPKPLIIHCKSGADRTGLASFIYRTVFLEQRFNVAKKSLGFRYFHNRFGKAGVLDDFITTYRADAQRLGLTFEEWLYTTYDPETLHCRSKKNSQDLAHSNLV